MTAMMNNSLVVKSGLRFNFSIQKGFTASKIHRDKPAVISKGKVIQYCYHSRQKEE